MSDSDPTVLTGAHAQRILLDGTRATGVEYRDAAGVTQRVAASREVILSVGTSTHRSC